MTRKAIAVLGLLLVFGFAGQLQAQTATTGQIAGDIVDPTGAVVPGAKVVLSSQAGVQRELTSDAAGHYTFILLPPGVYSLEVRQSGFRPVKFDNITVRITETSNLQVELKLATVQQEAVVVSAEPPLVQVTSASTGRVIAETQIKQLPLPTRNFQQLLTLSPGAVANLSNNTEMGRGDVNIAVNGQRSTSNNVMVDGAQVNSAGTNSTPNISVPAPDALQEFIVQTSLYDASQGRNSGGNIAVVTRSGSNTFHGSLYEFLRNEKLNANEYFLNRSGRPRPALKRNQFGGTIGGPVVKDKTFFFLSYQGTRERNGASLTNSLTSPNIPAGLTNDRSDAGLATLLANVNAVRLARGQTPIAAIHANTAALLKATLPNGGFAIPSAGGAGANALTPVLTPIATTSRFREDQVNLKLDHNFTASNKLSATFFGSNTPQYQALFSFVGSNPFQLPGYGGFITFRNRVATITDTHIFTPNLINEARVAYSRINGPSRPEEPLTNSRVGINNPLCATNPSFCGLATIQVLGLFSLGSTTLADQRSTVATFEYSDMATWTRGRHTVKLGGDVRRYHVDFFFNFFSRGQINFNTFDDFLAGNIAFGLLGNGIRNRNYRATDFDLFVQDDWRVTHKLTLNAGVRLQRNGGISDIHGRLANFDEAEFAKSQLPCTVAAPCSPPNGFKILKAGEPLNPNDWTVAPRFGFSYQPSAKNLVVRGGIGVYFDRFSTRVANLQIFNYPFDVVGLGLGSFVNPFPNLATTSFPITPATIPSPISLYFAGVPLPSSRTAISGLFVSPEFRTPYVYQYNLGMQYEPVRNWLVELGYVGSKGTKLINVYTLNQGALGSAPYNIPSLGVAGATAMFSNNKVLNGFQRAETTGISHYNSFQASLTKRLSKGLQFLTAYTFSKSQDDNSGAPTNEFAALPGDQQNRATQRSLSDFDRKHRLVWSVVYDFPKLYKGEMGFAKKLFNDWQVAGITTLQSGLPFSVTCISGSALYNRADVTGSGPLTVDGPVDQKLNGYFNTASFGVPGVTPGYAACANAAPYGNSGRNSLRGPDQRNVDLSVVKFIPIQETQKVELRTEFFNAFNFVNFALPNNNVMVPGTLGKITQTSAGPRVIQFALKYSF